MINLWGNYLGTGVGFLPVGFGEPLIPSSGPTMWAATPNTRLRCVMLEPPTLWITCRSEWEFLIPRMPPGNQERKWEVGLGQPSPPAPRRKGKSLPFGRAASVSVLVGTSAGLALENSFLDVLSTLFSAHLTSSWINMVVLFLLWNTCL